MELPRKLGLFSAVTVLIGSTIGSGIFRSSAGIAARIPDERLFLAAWIVGGVCVLAGALTYAELASALPRTGGIFVYLRESFGRLPAFLFGWAELTVIRASALGTIATVFAEYLLRMLGASVTKSGAVHYVAAAAVYVLRRKRPDLARPYRVWGYPVTPAIFLAAALFLLSNALVTGTAILVFVIVLLGIPAYWIWEHRSTQL